MNWESNTDPITKHELWDMLIEMPSGVEATLHAWAMGYQNRLDRVYETAVDACFSDEEFVDEIVSK